MRILCIDDDPSFLRVITTLLEKTLTGEDEVITATQGKEGIKHLQEAPVDICFTDLKLPDMNGIEVLKAAKNARMATEVIVITGEASVDSALEAMKNGARDYLRKPVKLAELQEKLSTVRELLQRTEEAEEYRYAKEVIEDQASRALGGLELRLAALVNTHKEARRILCDNSSDALIVERLKDLFEIEDDNRD